MCHERMGWPAGSCERGHICCKSAVSGAEEREANKRDDERRVVKNSIQKEDE